MPAARCRTHADHLLPRSGLMLMTSADHAPIAVPELAGDATWATLQAEADRTAATEPLLRAVLDASVTRHGGFAAPLAPLLARKLAGDALGPAPLAELASATMEAGAATAAEADLLAIRDRDPVAGGLLAPFLHYKGFHALQAHRVAHWLWTHGRCDLARLLQARTAERLGATIADPRAQHFGLGRSIARHGRGRFGAQRTGSPAERP